MKLLEKLNSVKLELNVCKVFVPELGDEPQYVAELSGEEYGDFVDWWTKFKEQEECDDNRDFTRAAVAFCWCDEDRNRLVDSYVEFAKCVKALRSLPVSFTQCLFAPADALNGFLGVNLETKKLLLEVAKSQKNEGGSGESH